MSIQRWRIGSSSDTEATPDDIGAWVRYDDYFSALQSATETIRNLTKSLKEMGVLEDPLKQ